jgi:hypothetical protein
MDPTTFEALKLYGPWVAIALAWGLPFLRDRLWPDYVAGRKADKEEARRREDLLFQLGQNMTTAMVSLQKTLEGMARQMAEQADILHGLTEDMAVVRAKLNMDRPVRGQARAKGE